jgi:tRNA U34 5-carboxymethylaminomethyl modifying GTPase MnmE/TrmE
MNDLEKMQRIDGLLSHVWMVRTFIKHSEETEEDDELKEVHRELYDYMHALGPFLQTNDAPGFLKQARKKIKKLREATDLFLDIQPEISEHTNFKMAAISLRLAVMEVEQILQTA